MQFNQLFKNEDFDVVQLHSAEIFEYKNGTKDFVGFCGVFEWKNNCIEPLDGDSYCDKFKVIGYEKFINEEENVKNGIDILVGEDW